MRVAVDARHLAHRRGIARYTQGLLTAAGGPDWTAVAPGGAPLLAVPMAVRRPPRAAHAAGALLGRPSLEDLAGGADVALLPAPAPLAVRGPFVLVVHDLSWLQRPADFTARERRFHRAMRMDGLMRRAHAVVAVSGATRDAVLARWPGTRVAVVHPGVDVPRADPALAAAVRQRFAIEGPVVLFAGALEPRKAPDLLLRAWARARPAATLVLAGGDRHGGAAIVRGAPGVVVTGHLDRPDLEALMCDATAVVLPSWLEGFGLPPLEALAAGVAPVVADLPVYDETVGDGALRVAPGDEAGLAAALARIVADADLRDELVACGRPRAAAFTWERCAAGVTALLEEAAA